MRTILLGFVLALGLQTVLAQSTPAPAEDVLNAAIKTAAKENKSVLAIFHASWCGWCHKMTASLNDPSIKPLFDKYYVIADFTVYETKGKENLENPGAADLLKKYNNADQGLPTWLVFDGKKNLIADSQIRPMGAPLSSKGENAGCPAAAAEVAHFIDCLKKSSSLNDSQLSEIAAVFRKNEIKR
ncbi:thioredoxin family protein [Sphingobacterium yanglingense]|uniref:Thioredoxin-related protein n=1 Tax=Sphingobacterium yanglingense TaxID=1437280 RepID=A0A4R6W979_9SPHI|nr:thioredoxin family protein [Sphingobacterium yanglingense]TDQ73739.1 thioredoxin-related protein [Sphingobacterium yanglingense]